MHLRYRSTALIAGLTLAGCQASGPSAANASLESDDEIISYAFGHQIADQLSVWESHIDMSALLAILRLKMARLAGFEPTTSASAESQPTCCPMLSDTE